MSKSPVFITSEVDRYLSNPGQALGPRFDLRRFNNAVIDQGSLPLDVLSQQVEDWVKAGG